MGGETMAAGYVSMASEAIQRCYGLAEADLLRAARLAPGDLRDPDAGVPLAAFHALLRFTLDRTQDPGLGLRIASAIDLRTQGFWGYAMLSSSSMHERVERHLRYQPLRFPCELSFRVEGETSVLDVTHRATPTELVPIVLDWAFACACIQMARQMQSSRAPIALWLGYAEQSYHHALRALVAGNVTFDAPYNRLTFATRELDRPLAGDPHLGRLAVGQLEQRLAEQHKQLPQDTLAQVRQRVRARLAVDPSLERVAHDLGVSARTLRRQLSAYGVSFQALLEEERRAHALAALVETDATIDVVAARLGYSESANFRRAFRRWTGMSPGAFRAASRTAGAAHTTTANDPTLAEKAPATRAAQRRHSRLER